MPFSAILLVFKTHMFSFYKSVNLQTIILECPYFYGLSVKLSNLLHLVNEPLRELR